MKAWMPTDHPKCSWSSGAATVTATNPSGGATGGVGAATGNGNNGNNNSGSANQATANKDSTNLGGSLLENKDPLHVDEILTRIEHQQGVLGVLIMNMDGVVIRSSMDNVLTIQYSSLMNQLATMARGVVRDLDPENDMRVLRVRTKKHQIMVSQAKQFLIVVVQNPDEQ